MPPPQQQREVIVKCIEKFKILYDLPKEIYLVVIIGGRGGAKTYEVSKLVAFFSTIKRKRVVILRDEKSLVRESILNEVLLRYDTANATGALDAYYERLDTGIKDRKTSEMFVFSKGFRASNNEKKANLKSISNIDVSVIEEMEDIRSEEAFNTFSDSIRKEGSIIICILNTPDTNHFLIKRYFNTKQITAEDVPELNTTQDSLEGYFAIEPKTIPGFKCIQTGYKDNPYLPQHIQAKYADYGNPDSHLYNLHYYLTAICGFTTSGRKGLVLPRVKAIRMEEYIALPFVEYYGLDFGTSSPAGLVGVKFDKSNTYVRELSYKPMTTLQIARTLCTLRIENGMIIADSADPNAIVKLRSGWVQEELSEDDVAYYPQLLTGFNVFGAQKGKDSIKYGVDQLNSKNLFFVEESINLWEEQRNYIYAVDRNENPTDMPVDGYNHLIDPLRYVDRARGIYF